MQPFIGQISVFGFNFAPRGWAQCVGQILPIAQYTSVFALLGTTYGGNGTTTFGLPNMQGHVAPGQGNGPGLQQYALGETGGVETVTLTEALVPPHAHSLMTNPVLATSNKPAGNVLAIPATADFPTPAQGKIYNPNTPNVALTSVVTPAPGGQPHPNLQPALALNYCICLDGIFPERG